MWDIFFQTVEFLSKVAANKRDKRSETTASNAVHKDALLSGPLLAPSNQLSEPREKSSKRDSTGQHDSDPELPFAVGPLGKPGINDGHSRLLCTTLDKDRFRGCFMRVLRPSCRLDSEARERGNSIKYEVVGIKLSGCGRLLLAAGRMEEVASATSNGNTPPETPQRDSGPDEQQDAVMKGWFCVWQQVENGFWAQWEVDGTLEHPVEAMAVLGSAIALGHKKTSKGSGPAGSEHSSYSFKHSSSDHNLFEGSEEGHQGDLGFAGVSLWRIDFDERRVVRSAVVDASPAGSLGSSVKDMNYQQSFNSGSLSSRRFKVSMKIASSFMTPKAHVHGVSCLRWLSRPLGSCSKRPPPSTVLASVSCNGHIALWSYRHSDREGMDKITLIDRIHLPYTEDTHEQRRHMNDLDFLSRINSEDEDMLLAASTMRAAMLWKYVSPMEGSGAHKQQQQPHLVFWKKLSHPREVMAVSFRQALGTDKVGDADLLITACMDYRLRVWDVDNAVCIRVLQNHTNHFSQCIFSCHGNVILSGSEGGRLLLFDTFTGMRIKTIGGHRDTVTGMALVPGSDGVLATGSTDGTVRLWEIKSNPGGFVTPKQSEDKELRSTVYRCRFAKNATQVVSCHRDGSIRFSRVADGLPAGEDLLAHKSYIFGLAVHPYENLVATASHDASVRIWDLDSEECIWSYSQASKKRGKEFSSVDFHPNGKWLVAGSYTKAIYLFVRPDQDAQFSDGEQEWELAGSWKNHTDRVWAVKFSTCGHWMASGAWDHEVQIYNTHDVKKTIEEQAAKPESRREKYCHTRYSVLDCSDKVWDVAFRPVHDTHLSECMVATGSADKILRIWSRESHRWNLIVELKGHEDTVTGVDWHPDGHALVTSSFDKTARLWGKDEKGAFVALGIFCAFQSPTLDVRWEYQMPTEPQRSGTMIAVATFRGLIYVTDATDAEQPFVSFGRAQHILSNGSMQSIHSVFNSFPETLLSLGPKESGMVLFNSIVKHHDNPGLLNCLLDCAKDIGIPLLLPYTCENMALLSCKDYRTVSSVINTIVEMYEAGDKASSLLLSTGYGTMSILELLKTFPDQAVVMLNHFGMTESSAIVYGSKWNPYKNLADGVYAHRDRSHKISNTRNPVGLWQDAEDDDSSLIGWDSNRHHTIAAFSSFPYITGIPPREWSNSNGAFRISGGKAPRYHKLDNTFLHLAYQSKNPLLFDTALGSSIIQFKWYAYGRTVYLVHFLYFIVALTVITLQALAWGGAYRQPNCAIGVLAPDLVCINVPHNGLSLSIAVIAVSSVSFVYNVFRVWRVGRSYVGFWHFYEFILLPMTFLSGLMTYDAVTRLSILGYSNMLEYVPIVTSVAAFMTWLKCLYFMRAFSGTGGLVRLMIEITYDMRWMMLLSIIGICAAMTAFYALPPHRYFNSLELDGSLDDVWGMAFFTFSMMLSSFNSANITGALSQFLAMVFLTIQALLLLNALIALMSESAAKLQDNIKVIALRERAGLLMEMELVLGRQLLRQEIFRPRWLHSLVAEDKMPANANSRSAPSNRASGYDGGDDVMQLCQEMMVAIRSVQAEQQKLAERLDLVQSRTGSMTDALPSTLPSLDISNLENTSSASAFQQAAAAASQQSSMSPPTNQGLAGVDEQQQQLEAGGAISPIRTSLMRSMTLGPVPEIPANEPGGEMPARAASVGLKRTQSLARQSTPKQWWKQVQVSVESGRGVGTDESTTPYQPPHKPRARYRK